MNTHFSLPFRQNLDQQMPNMRALIQISEFSQRENHDFENCGVFGPNAISVPLLQQYCQYFEVRSLDMGGGTASNNHFRNRTS